MASVSTASGLTAGGNKPNRKINKAITDLYCLSPVDAPILLLVLTTPGFRPIFVKELIGATAGGIAIECLPLPSEMQRVVDVIVSVASLEPAKARRPANEQVEVEAGL